MGDRYLMTITLCSEEEAIAALEQGEPTVEVMFPGRRKAPLYAVVNRYEYDESDSSDDQTKPAPGSGEVLDVNARLRRLEDRLTEIEKALCLLAEAIPKVADYTEGPTFTQRIGRGDKVKIKVDVWPEAPSGTGYRIQWFEEDSDGR